MWELDFKITGQRFINVNKNFNLLPQFSEIVSVKENENLLLASKSTFELVIQIFGKDILRLFYLSLIFLVSVLEENKSDIGTGVTTKFGNLPAILNLFNFKCFKDLAKTSTHLINYNKDLVIRFS